MDGDVDGLLVDTEAPGETVVSPGEEGTADWLIMICVYEDNPEWNTGKELLWEQNPKENILK